MQGCPVAMRLVLFFTSGISLRTWDTIGSLDREVALYKAILPKLGDVKFVTYGDRRDLLYARQLGGIDVVCNRWNLSKHWYMRLLSQVYPRFWGKDVLVKSNQIPGSDVALRAAQNCGKKFIARCGYLPSNIAKTRQDMGPSEIQRAQELEETVFRGADRVVVTTPMMRRTVVDSYGVEGSKVRVIPNYVDVKRFKPSSSSKEPKLLCYVGRLEPEKNVEALLNAVEGLDIELHIIGGGSLKDRLTAQAQKKLLPVRFIGNVPNNELPTYLSNASVFILPSHIEHHPKALIEAMACGLPVIGTDVYGIRELIEHRQTGYSCDTSPEALREAIADVMADADLRLRLGRNAREFAVEHFALDKIVDMELSLLEELIG
ncbi:MAG: glycosyltransferase family 4 protein [Deltaproteobacteria bacterium]|nr:glycosyltransferase family 4 protein [Deltaproteobacteria bacterium]